MPGSVIRLDSVSQRVTDDPGAAYRARPYQRVHDALVPVCGDDRAAAGQVEMGIPLIDDIEGFQRRGDRVSLPPHIDPAGTERRMHAAAGDPCGPGDRRPGR